ncbi:hypothetical protein NDU88_002011 [Pleurodeles waltl]|uniref:Uncharacterized protein n=1 Tax=Pleurodeles waltl TaxID=8319 RepID=A0AAV7U8H5_PLEWA|nr:hypothetical protein NDU88_002011 [Pleurodeles waltl]
MAWKSDEEGVLLAALHGAEESRDPKPLTRQTGEPRHVPGGTWLTQGFGSLFLIPLHNEVSSGEKRG